MWFRKLSPSAFYWINRFWQMCMVFFLFLCEHLWDPFVWYSNVANIVSNTLKPVFSLVHSSLVIIHWFVRMSWSRCSSFHSERAVHDHSEHGLSFMSRSPWQKCTTHHLTVLTSTVWSPETFSKYQWMSVSAIFSAWRNSVSHLCFIYPSVSDTILTTCPFATIGRMATTCNGIVYCLLSCHQNLSLMLWAIYGIK